MRLFSKGKRVTQPQYGPGTILSTDDQYTVVEFDNHGRRTFVTTMVTLEATTEAAPDRSRRRTGKPRRSRAKKAGTTASAS